MSVAIVYASRYGATAQVVRRVTGKLSTQVKAYDLADVRKPDLGDAEVVVIGGPIYAGRLLERVRTYAEAAERELLSRRLVLFITCFFQGDRAREQLANAFPADLYEHASESYAAGGAVAFDKLSFFHKIIMKRVGGLTESVERFDEVEIDRMITDLEALA